MRDSRLLGNGELEVPVTGELAANPDGEKDDAFVVRHLKPQAKAVAIAVSNTLVLEQVGQEGWLVCVEVTPQIAMSFSLGLKLVNSFLDLHENLHEIHSDRGDECSLRCGPPQPSDVSFSYTYRAW